MVTVIDKITLKHKSYADDFIQWVTEVDYLACHDLPSVQAFQVHRVKSRGDCDFLEIVQVSSWEAFEQDMQRPLFRSLVERFSQMADVSEQTICDPIAPGYRRQGLSSCRRRK